MIALIITISSLQWMCSTIFITATQDISNIRYSSLVSAQCKARCLYEYRTHHHQPQHYQQQRSLPTTLNHGKTNRLLTSNALTLPWRSIWERCPRLITCSSCLLPCDLEPPLLFSNEQSCQAICSTLQNVECQRSCTFVQSLYRQQSNCLTDDCQFSSCSRSNDCFEKIPQPSNVNAVERKSRRTVKLKWTSNEMNNSEPIFYVIEAQWTLSNTELYQQNTFSKWGFLKEEVSHTKAIIRNIQRDNRWYTFRVAAVTRHGYSSFSATTEPFRLSSSSKDNSQKSISTIATPKNLSIKDYQVNFNTINVTLAWEKPDISINGYQISWKAQNDPSSIENTIDISSSLDPLEFTIPSLSMHTTYIFKIRSIIIPDGDLVETSGPISIKYNYNEELFSLKNLQISEAYFISGLIKANISWNKISDPRIKQYDVHWIETHCSSDVLSCCYRRDAVTIENSFQLYDLRFNCTYLLNIKPVSSRIRIKKSFQAYFNVTSCQLIQTYGTIRPPCQRDEKVTSSPSTSLNLDATRNESGIQFSWQNILPSTNDGTDIVYRLRIEQLPRHFELISVDLSSTITNYFSPFSQLQTARNYNVTLTLYDHSQIREQESILIEGHANHYISNRNSQLSIVSSSVSIRTITMKSSLLLILCLLTDLIR